MSDSRFYVVALLLFGAFVIAALVTLNTLQPSGVDVELIKQILLFSATVVGPLVVLVNSNWNRKQIESKGEEVKQVVHDESRSIKRDAENTMSSLAREKGRP